MKLKERYRWRARSDCDWGTTYPTPYRGHVWREEFKYRGEAKRRWAVSIDGRNDVFYSEYWESKHRAIEKAQQAAGFKVVLDPEINVHPVPHGTEPWSRWV